MQLQAVKYDKKGYIATIKFNRPQVLNAVNLQLVLDFTAALQLAKDDDEVTVVILTGEGRAFCSGADLKYGSTIISAVERSKYVNRIQNIQRLILELGKPMIAAVRGYALGAGCEFALSCDLRVASENARFGFPEVSVGGTVTTAGTKLIAQLVGLGRAKEMLFTAEMVAAQKAMEWGLVNAVVPDADLEGAAVRMAEKIAKNSPLSVRLTRKAVDLGLSASFEEVLEIENRHAVEATASGETQKRMTARMAEMKEK